MIFPRANLRTGRKSHKASIRGLLLRPRGGFGTTLVLALVLLAQTAGSGLGQPKSILPPVLGGGGLQPEPVPQFDLGPLAPVGAEPPPAPTPQQLPDQGPAMGQGQGVLGTLPATALDQAGGNAAGSGANLGGGGGNFAALFNKITGPMPTAGTQSTLRKLLLDASFRGSGGGSGLARAQALYRLGYIEDAAGIIVEIDGQGVARLAATAKMMLALGRTGQACEVADVSDLPKGAAAGPTFALLEILAFCKLENGDKKAAGLIARVLKDQGGGDALYRALMASAISGKPARINARKAKTFRPVHAALFARTGQVVPTGLVARADLAVLSAIARSAAAPGLRLAATERLVASGLSTFLELDALYAEVGPPDFDPATALKNKVAASAIGRASIYRLLDEIGDDHTRMALATTAYDGARKAGAGASSAVLFSDIVSAIVPRPELARFSQSAVRLLFDADRPDIAAGWIAAAEFADNKKHRLGPMKAHKLKAIAAILAPDAGFGLGAGALGSDVGSVKLSKSDRKFIALEARLLAALGDYVPPVLTELGGGRAPRTVEAVEVGPVEAIASLAPLGGHPIGKISGDILTRAIAALRGLGLEGEARRLAADHLLARL